VLQRFLGFAITDRSLQPPFRQPSRAAAWAVHAYTASGVVLAFLSLRATLAGEFRAAFAWLFLATVIDATDGWLARFVRTDEATPSFDGATLDNIVDYLTFVFVPAVLAAEAGLLPRDLAVMVVSAVLLSSAYGFSRKDAKTSDHFFTGFPSYWNVVVFYLYAAGWPAGVNAGLLAILSALVFVPLPYVYPSRTPFLSKTTNTLCVVWAILLVWMIWRLPDVSRAVLLGSLAFPAYYVGLSLVLAVRRGLGSGRRR
jgi:phosphatidylcholine synthase